MKNSVKIMMKLFAIITILICLVACGKSEMAIKVDNEILNIGEVSIDSESIINKVEKMVSELNKDDYEQLENLNLLKEARNTYDELLLESEAKVIEDLIDTMGKVTLNSEAIINAVRDRYDRCYDNIKKRVSNYNTLEIAEKELSNMKIENVIALIDDIGEVTLEKEDLINKVYTMYKKLSKNEKDGVTNKQILIDINSTLNELIIAKKEEELENAIKNVEVKKDKVEDVTWYYSTKVNMRKSFIDMIVGEGNENLGVIVRYCYIGDEWIFADKITIVIDGEKQYRFFDECFNTDYGGGKVIEEFREVGNEYLISMFEDIANSEETILRFTGDKSFYDMIVSDSEKEAIKDVIAVCKALQWKLDNKSNR